MSDLRDFIRYCAKVYRKQNVLITSQHLNDLSMTLSRHGLPSMIHYNVKKKILCQLSNSYFPLIHKPTRIVNKSASLIDNMYTNYTYDSCNCGILCSDFSDHFSVFCIIDCLTLTDNKPSTLTKRNFNNKNIAKFSRKLYNQN